MLIDRITARPEKVSRALYLATALAPALVMLSCLPAAAQDETVFPVAQVTLPGGQKIVSFDISYVDTSLGLYLLGDRTNKAVDVLNTSGPSFLMQAGKGLFAGATGNNNTSGPDGVLTVNGAEIWAGDGDSTIKVLSVRDGSLITVISTGPASQNRVDEMCVDPVHDIVLAANNASSPWPILSFIQGKGHQVIKQIALDGTTGTPPATNGAEQCQWNPRTGQFYVSIPEFNGPGDNSAPGGVAQIDPVTLTVVQTLTVPLSACSGPQGMAIGPANGLNGGTGQILLGCNGGPNQPATRPTAIVDDNLNPSTIFTVPQEWGSDMVAFNSANNHYGLARSSATPNQVLGVIDSLGGSTDPDLFVKPAGAPNAHSIAADPVHNTFFFPTPTGSTLCSSVGGNDAQGCILVLNIQNDDDDNGGGKVISRSTAACTAEGAPVVQGRQPLTGPC
jgi:hypothetical protein